MPEVSIFFIGVGDREHHVNSIRSCTMHHQSPLSIMGVIEPRSSTTCIRTFLVFQCLSSVLHPKLR